MTKSELISILYKNTDHFTMADVEVAVNTIINSLNSSICAGKRIEIRSFGSFSLHERVERIGRNPRTGDKVVLGKRYAIHFKPGKNLRDKINKSFLEGN